MSTKPRRLLYSPSRVPVPLRVCKCPALLEPRAVPQSQLCSFMACADFMMSLGHQRSPYGLKKDSLLRSRPKAQGGQEASQTQPQEPGKGAREGPSGSLLTLLGQWTWRLSLSQLFAPEDETWLWGAGAGGQTNTAAALLASRVLKTTLNQRLFLFCSIEHIGLAGIHGTGQVTRRGTSVWPVNAGKLIWLRPCLLSRQLFFFFQDFFKSNTKTKKNSTRPISPGSTEFQSIKKETRSTIRK